MSCYHSKAPEQLTFWLKIKQKVFACQPYFIIWISERFNSWRCSEWDNWATVSTISAFVFEMHDYPRWNYANKHPVSLNSDLGLHIYRIYITHIVVTHIYIMAILFWGIQKGIQNICQSPPYRELREEPCQQWENICSHISVFEKDRKKCIINEEEKVESEYEWKCKDCMECSWLNCNWTPKPYSPPDRFCSFDLTYNHKRALSQHAACHVKITITSQ